MRFRNFMSVVLAILGISIGLAQTTSAQTRLGLHVTQEELDIWRQRAVSGPYKTAGDAGPFTPGDWDRIVSNKNSFMSNPNAEIYQGYTGGGCVPKGANIAPTSYGMKVMDAAFFALVQNDATVRTAVRNYLRAQIAVPGTDFGNTSKWCRDPDSSRLNDNAPGFNVAEWANRVLYAYDYIRSTLSPEDRKAIDAWFLNAGIYYRINGGMTLYNLYSDWLKGTLNSSGQSIANDCNSTYGRTHVGGNQICRLGRFYNNRRAHITAFYAQVGIMLNDELMKSWAKRFVQEYLKYQIYPDGTHNELERSHGTGNVETGWAYSAQTLGRVLVIADAFARIGDTSLYEFSTMAGSPGMTGRPKTLRLAADMLIKTTQGTMSIYKYGSPVKIQTLIDGVRYSSETASTPQGFYAYDVWLGQHNIYWREQAVKDAYLVPGAVNKQGTNNVLEPNFSWRGAGNGFPGKLFMFGQMEGKVWPYKASEPSPLAAPANFRSISAGQ